MSRNLTAEDFKPTRNGGFVPQPTLAKTDSDLVEALTQANIDNDKIVKVFTTLAKGRKADALRQAEIRAEQKAYDTLRALKSELGIIVS